MSNIKIVMDYPEDILLALNESSEEFAQKLKLLAATKLYELGKLSLGKAAELAGIDKVNFMWELGKYNVPVIKYSLESLKQEVDLVKELANEK